MSKAYQVVTEQGLVIPPALCASAQLGDEVLLEIEPGRIAIRPARLNPYEAQRRALFYVLTHLGDALRISAPSLELINATEQWHFNVSRKATGEHRGLLALNAETGEVISWMPSADAIN
ncbi:MAG: hypothetical protein HOP19_00845 [Acidobacteria bacterium]|nr:hypothetical protein [Acidobacteriota bacterium]